MHVVEIRDLDGPNVFLLKPAIKVEFRSENKADELATARRLDGGNDLGGSLLAVVDMLHERAGIEGVDVVVTPMELPGHLSVAFSWRNRRAGRLIGQAIAALAMGESIDIDAVAAEVADFVAHPVESDAPELITDAMRRVPAIGITGTNGKTTTTRLLAHIATTAGRVAGS